MKTPASSTRRPPNVDAGTASASYVDGSHVMGHAAKAGALLGFYSSLLGRATTPV